ncbi:MAG TPA: beta-eliminating lyase-related protein [Solirubrobacteraceae bacterium]|jgi:threonine aldolase|nr:beta-eliminating lyase-related protein [Solirubrobacteraceae bacterium]
MKGFASDNNAGAHPQVLAAMAQANDGHATAYGHDPWTDRALELLREHFGEQARSYLVFNGTAANVLCLRAMCRPWQSVICAADAHVNVDEGGAPERIAGVKLQTVATADGKLTPELAATRLGGRVDEHVVQPRVVSVSQSSELGTRYSVDELTALATFAHEHDLLLHVDGARLANAATSLGVPLRATATDAGVDALSFGATKNGIVFGEAVVLLAPGLDDGFAYLRKQTLQLASKGRFLAAQFVALLEGDLWQRSAAHANAMAARLAAAIADAPDVRITQPVQANGVFAVLAPAAIEALQRDWYFYVWDDSAGEVRWMCSWDTTPEEVDAFAAAIRTATAAAAREPSARR